MVYDKESDGALKAQLEAMLETAADFAFFKDAGFRYVLVNRAYERLFGCKSGTIIGKTDFDLMPEDEAKTCRESDKLALTSQGLICREEFVFGRWFEVRKQALRDEEGRATGIVGVARDITERKQAEEQRLQSIARVARRHKALVRMSRAQGGLEGGLEGVLKHICELAAEAVQVERVSIWQLSDDKSRLRCLNLFQRSTGEHTKGIVFDAADYPRYFQAIEASRALIVDEARLDGRTAEFVQDYLTPLGIYSMLDAPIRLKGSLVGIVCFEHTGAGRRWTQGEVSFAGEVADQVAVAMLHERWRKSALFVEMNPAPVLCLDADGLVTEANPMARQVMGRVATCDRPITESLPELRSIDIRKLIETGGDAAICVRLGERTFQFTLVGLPEQRCAHVYSMDITGRLAAETNLRLAETVFQETPMGIIITDANANILRVNRAFTEITGYAAEEVLGKNPRLMRSGRHDEAFYQNMWASLLQTGCWEGEIWNRRKSGDVYPQWETIAAVRNNEGKITHFIASFTDITEKKLSEAHVYRLAHYDALTNLPNRSLLMDRLSQAIAQAKRRSAKVAVLFFDLDNFKLINDTMGHATGDLLLQLLAGKLKSCVREEDTVARIGGDEFVAVLTGIASEQDAMMAARKILAIAHEPLLLEGRQMEVAFSLGISLFPDDGADADVLLKHADIALYQAKQAGKGRYQFFIQDMTRKLEERQRLETELKQAIEAGQFMLHYQPQVALSSGKIVGVEALIRWTHPKMGMVPPFKFIPVAEETGLIVPLGQWVLEEACRQLHAWRQQGIHVRMSINISPRQLRDRSLLRLLSDVLDSTDMEPAMLELELTESCLMDDPESGVKLTQDIKNMGIHLAMDDFGTGYSSLSYLKRFAMDTLKIDQVFVRGLPDDEQDAAIASTIIAMARNLGMQVLAEGVEHQAQLEFLKSKGCDIVQGYLFSKPVPAGMVEQQLRIQRQGIDASKR